MGVVLIQELINQGETMKKLMTIIALCFAASVYADTSSTGQTTPAKSDNSTTNSSTNSTTDTTNQAAPQGSDTKPADQKTDSSAPKSY